MLHSQNKANSTHGICKQRQWEWDYCWGLRRTISIHRTCHQLFICLVNCKNLNVKTHVWYHNLIRRLNIKQMGALSLGCLVELNAAILSSKFFWIPSRAVLLNTLICMALERVIERRSLFIYRIRLCVRVCVRMLQRNIESTPCKLVHRVRSIGQCLHNNTCMLKTCDLTDNVRSTHDIYTQIDILSNPTVGWLSIWKTWILCTFSQVLFRLY